MRTMLGMMALLIQVLLLSCASGPRSAGQSDPSHAEVAKTLDDFIQAHTAQLSPLYKDKNLAYWRATTGADPEAYQEVTRLELAMRKLHADPVRFAELQRLRQAAAGSAETATLRQAELLAKAFAENQIETDALARMVTLTTRVEKTFSQFKGTLEGQPASDNQLKAILRSSTDPAMRRAAWVAYKAKGAAVQTLVLELVGLRNQAARALGFKNYYQMRLVLQEQDPERIQALFDELARLTDGPFAVLKAEIDAEIGERFGIAPAALMPWHYDDPFFQEPPRLRGLELDPLFVGRDPRKVVQGFFVGVGLDPADILEHSDLYEKPGKMPHAYCEHIDRAGDVRILANLEPNEQWTSTLMHEMGHAVYDRFLNMDLPWLLRTPAHPFTTEAVAMLFGRQTRNPAWLVGALGAPSAKVEALRADLARSQRMGMLVFARWAMVMMNFERQLYADPDQDLNKLWWDLKERYQLVRRPPDRNAPDWASKIHVAAWPAYYHNYLLGELMASQLLDTLAREVVPGGDPKDLDLVGQEQVGAWLKANIFAPGASLRWDELLKKATGSSLDPKYFAQQFFGDLPVSPGATR